MHLGLQPHALAREETQYSIREFRDQLEPAGTVAKEDKAGISPCPPITVNNDALMKLCTTGKIYTSSLVALLCIFISRLVNFLFFLFIFIFRPLLVPT